jgi:hypothetical protein
VANVLGLWVGSAIVALSLGCGNGTEVESDTAFWDELRFMVIEVEHYGSVGEMANSAEIVVRGHLVDYRLSRIIGGELGQGGVPYAVVDLVTSEVLRGEGVPERLPVEFTVLIRLDQDVERVFAEQASRLPEGEVIAFVRGKDSGPRSLPGDAGKYRLVNTSGLWTMLGERLAAPLSEVESDRRMPYETELSAVDALDELAELIRR